MKVSFGKQSTTIQVKLIIVWISGQEVAMLLHGDPGHLTDLSKGYPAWEAGSCKNLLPAPFREGQTRTLFSRGKDKRVYPRIRRFWAKSTWDGWRNFKKQICNTFFFLQNLCMSFRSWSSSTLFLINKIWKLYLSGICVSATACLWRDDL